MQLLGLRGMPAFAAIELGRGWRGDQRVRAGVQLHINAKFVTADDTARRMHQVDMARIAFGIKRPLNDERSLVMPLGKHRTGTGKSGTVFQEMGPDPKSETQLGLPSWCVANDGGIHDGQTVRCS